MQSQETIRKALIIDDDIRFRRLIKRYFTKISPTAIIEEYDPQQGRPTEGFDWGQYDLLILDHCIGLAETGMDWLKICKNNSNKFPATIYLTGQGNGGLLREAMKSGAHNYLRKEGLTTTLLNDAVQQALIHRQEEFKKVDTLTLSTAIFNKVRFYKKLETLAGNGMLLMVEVDKYKEIYEQYGMLVSDGLSSFIAKKISLCLTKNDLIGVVTRIGDATTACLISYDELNSDGEVVIKSICDILSGIKYTDQDDTIEFTISIGAVPLSGQTDKVNTIFKKADATCRLARQISGNSYIIYSGKELLKPASDKKDFSLLVNAIEEDRVRPYYQQLVYIKDVESDRDAEYYQIRVKLLDAQGQEFAPDNYIPILKDSGKLGKLDRWVIRHVAGKIVKLKKIMSKKVGFFIALSEDSLLNDNLTTWISELFKYIDQPDLGSTCIFDIRTEHFITHSKQIKKIINNLRDTFQISFSLINVPSASILAQCLHDIKFEYIKYSPTLFSSSSSSLYNTSEISRIIRCARENGVLTIAEKIETSEQFSIATDAGTDYVSGYLVQSPLLDILGTERVVI